MSDLTAQQYYNELIEAGKANDFTKLTSTGISSNYQNVFAFAEDYFEARMQANGQLDNHEQALPINSVTHRALQMKIEKLEAENKLLAFMVENGLGEEDMKNDITLPQEI